MASSAFLFAQLLFLLCVVLQPEISSGLKVVDMSGALVGTKCCKDKAQQYIQKAATESRTNRNTQSYCAVLFENAACDSCRRFISGWDTGIKEGKKTFGRLSRHRADAASVIVAPGCIFIGYDESDEDDDNKRTIASAIGRNDWVYKEFKELKNDIERVECHCGIDAANKLGKELDRFKRAKCKGNAMKYAASGLGGAALTGIASNVIKG